MAGCESQEDCKVRRYRVHPDKDTEIHPDTPIKGLKPERGEREKGKGKGKITETYGEEENPPRGTEIKKDDDVEEVTDEVKELIKKQVAETIVAVTPECQDGCICWIPTQYSDIRWPRDAFTYPKERRRIEIARKVKVSGKEWTFYYSVDVLVIKQSVILTGRCIDPKKYEIKTTSDKKK